MQTCPHKGDFCTYMYSTRSLGLASVMMGQKSHLLYDFVFSFVSFGRVVSLEIEDA